MTDRPFQGFDADETRDLQAIGIPTARRLTGCPDPALVLALDEGVLAEDLAVSVRAHVSSCPACQTAASDLAKVFDEDVPADIRRRIDVRLRESFSRNGENHSRSRLWYWLVPAGGLALATAGLIWAFLPLADPPAVPGTELARSTTTPLPTVFVVDRPAIPPGEIDLAVRGRETTPADVNNHAALALDRADAGDVKGAIAELEALVRKHPASRRAGLALGALQLRDARNAEALATLERARPLQTAPDMDDEVEWFLAIARIRAGDRSGARLLLEGVCKRGGTRSHQACAGVAEIDRLPSAR